MTQSLAIALAEEVADAAAEHATDQTSLVETSVNLKAASQSLAAAKDSLWQAVVDQRCRERTGTTQLKMGGIVC